MTLNPAEHSTQASFQPGCKVYVVGASDVQGVVAGAGAEVSEVKFADGKHRNIPNRHLRVVEAMNDETHNAKTDNVETDNATIENALTIVNLKPPAVITDGWDAAAIDMADNPMKGMQSASFDRGGFFTGKEKLLISPEKRFIALEVREGWLFLRKGTPPEIVMRPLGSPRPPRPDRYTNKDEWPFKLNSTTERDDPFKYNRFVFLLDPQSAQTTVFNTHTKGGDIGVNELVKAIQTMRAVHPGAVPIVQLESRQWKNGFGLTPRPFFRVVGWHFKDGAPQALADGGGQGGGPIKTVNAFDDKNPF